ncbi:MAG TPA: alpha-galactosidase [Candidatus Brocadiia bacterium]|nr:alpha-galactosidase [Candidatus Brocadiia bacterium]
MVKSKNFSARFGEWSLRFNPAVSVLDCRHGASGARLTGRLSFEGIRDGKTFHWRILPPLEGDALRLALMDPSGDCQGYVVPYCDGGRLSLTVAQRAHQRNPGRLIYDACASLGRRSFACRATPPPAGSQVVQMASGPADSALNDSIFDIACDCLLSFSGSEAALQTTGIAGDKQQFYARIEADAEDSARASITIEPAKDYYRSRWIPWYKPIDRTRLPSPPTGWMSWNVYFDQAGESENLAEARAGAKYLKPYGMEIWSIESWQDNSGVQPVRDFHNLTMEPFAEQFPSGMKWLADQIRKLGFKPGIWAVPYGTGSREFYESHKAWFLRDPDGAPIGNWSGRYVLDPSQPAVRAFMRESLRTMRRDWGYEFFKIDGMSGKSPSYSAHFYELPSVRAAFKNKCPNPFELCAREFRKGIGPDAILLACQGHYSGPEVAVSDAARIGADIVGIKRDPTWHNYLDQALTTLTQLFAHNIVWHNDPDTLLVGKFTEMSVARIATAVVGLPGQVMFAGDKLAELPPERMWLLQRCLPVCDAHPLDLFPIYELRSVWDLKINRPFGQWDVISLFNFDDKEKRRIGFGMRDIGLDPGGQYLIYDYWNGRLLGSFAESFSMELAPKSNALLAVHAALDRPQFISTDRHITQGGVGIRNVEWDADALKLSGEAELVKGEATTLTFFAPDGFRLREARAGRRKIVPEPDAGDGALRLKLGGGAGGIAAWSLRFAKT